MLGCEHQIREGEQSQAEALRAGEPAADAPGEVDAGEESDALWNPYMALAEVEGPTPLFERLNDESGHRYVVGEGMYQESEDGEPVRFASVRTMRPGTADPQERSTSALMAPEDSSKVSPELAQAVEQSAGNHLLEVSLALRHSEEGLQVSLDRAMAKGEISTHLDYDQEREVLIEERRARVQELTSVVAEAIVAAQGEVLRLGENSPYVIANLPAGAIDLIAQRPDVTKMDSTSKVGGPLADADGLAHQHGAQIRQFVTGNYTGEGPTAFSYDDLRAAIVELNFEINDDPASFYAGHAAWRESSPGRPFATRTRKRVDGNATV